MSLFVQKVFPLEKYLRFNPVAFIVVKMKEIEFEEEKED